MNVAKIAQKLSKNIVSLMLCFLVYLLLYAFTTISSSNILSELIVGTRDDIHIVVTTGCSGYQNWQSETLIYSWARLKQPGRFTRIIAGCKTDDERLKANTTAVNNDQNRIQFYFVKDYTPGKETEGLVHGMRPFW